MSLKERVKSFVSKPSIGLKSLTDGEMVVDPIVASDDGTPNFQTIILDGWKVGQFTVYPNGRAEMRLFEGNALRINDGDVIFYNCIQRNGLALSDRAVPIKDGYTITHEPVLNVRTPGRGVVIVLGRS